MLEFESIMTVKHLGLGPNAHIMTNYFPSFTNGIAFYSFVQDFYQDKFGNLMKLPLYNTNSTSFAKDAMDSQNDNDTFELRGYVTFVNRKGQTYYACPHCRRSINPNANSNSAQPSQPQHVRGNQAQVFRTAENHSYNNDAPVYDVSRDFQNIAAPTKSIGNTKPLIKSKQTDHSSDNSGKRVCVYCSKTLNEPETVHIANIRLTDFSDSLSATGFGGVSNIFTLGDETESDYPMYHEFKVKLRSGLDFDADKKFTIFGAKQIDYMEDSIDILQQLEIYKRLALL